MSCLGPASSRGRRLGDPPAWAWLLASVLLSAVPARAQSGARLLLFKGDPGTAAEERRTQLAQRVGPLADAAALHASAPRGVPAARLEPLRQVEGLLAQARAQAANLAEHDALATLAEAARLCEQLGDLPGAALWNAEVQLRIGVTAVQAQMAQLAREAFRRAATLDPARRLLAAEAAPEAVATYEQVKREVALAATGELAIAVRAPGAAVYLDDQLRGSAPLRVRTVVGRHLLRVEAEGYRAYGAFIDVFEGERPVLAIEPAPEPERSAALALERAAQAGDYAGVAASARALAEAGEALETVWVMELAADRSRALIVRCDAGGCVGPARLRGAPGRWSLPDAALDPERLARARDWLGAAGHTAWTAPSEPAWWERWYVWGGVAIAGGIAAAAIALGAASQPSGERRLQVILEPEALRSW